MQWGGGEYAITFTAYSQYAQNNQSELLIRHRTLPEDNNLYGSYLKAPYNNNESTTYYFNDDPNSFTLEQWAFNANESTLKGISSLHVKNAYCFGMFSNCQNLTYVYNLYIDNLCYDASLGGAYMSNMFYECYALTYVDLSNINTSNVEWTESMFMHCTSLVELDLSHNNLSNVQTSQYMFTNCTELTYLDISNWEVNSHLNYNQMFSGTPKLNRIKCRRSFYNLCLNFYTTMGLTNFNTITWDIVN